MKLCYLATVFLHVGVFLVVQMVEKILLQSGRPGFDPWVGEIPWRREWQPTPVSLPGESNGQRSLVGCSPWGHLLTWPQYLEPCLTSRQTNSIAPTRLVWLWARPALIRSAPSAVPSLVLWGSPDLRCPSLTVPSRPRLFPWTHAPHSLGWSLLHLCGTLAVLSSTMHSLVSMFLCVTQYQGAPASCILRSLMSGVTIWTTVFYTKWELERNPFTNDSVRLHFNKLAGSIGIGQGPCHEGHRGLALAHHLWGCQPGRSCWETWSALSVQDA